MRVPRRIDRRRGGAKFRRYNKARLHVARGLRSHRVRARASIHVPGAGLSYQHATTWSHSIEADGDGCVVTESFHAPVLATPDVYPGKIEGRRDNLERGSKKQWRI